MKSKHTRREFLGGTLAGAAELGLNRRPGSQKVRQAALAAAPSSVPAMNARTPGIHTPTWMREGIIMASAMEALTFIIRTGGQPAEEAELWHAERSEESIKRMKEIGVNVVLTNLFKGFGLKAEGEDIAATKKFTELAHKHGLKVFGYVGSTMMYETMFLEEADARHWMQRDELGHPVMYPGDETFRYAACRNTPGYRAFIEKVVRLGLNDVKLDGIHFDQMMWWTEPQSCREVNCREQFRDFLRERYTMADRARMRFGFSDFGGVIPPRYLSPPWTPDVKFPELRNPLMQEWALFRAGTLALRCGEYDKVIHQVNPQAAMIYNPPLNPAENAGFTNGIDFYQLLSQGDGVWTEEGNLPEWTADSRLISRIRSYKVARAMGQTLFLWQRYGGPYPTFPGVAQRAAVVSYQRCPVELRLAESMAYNDANLGVLAGRDAGGNDTPPEVIQQYIRFFKSHLKDLVHTSEVVDVAILRSFSSTQFNPSESNFSTVLFEQTLIQSKLPFGIIFDPHVKDLNKYKVLVLANQDALSDEQIEQIRTFVKGGGGLVATEDTSMWTEQRTWRGRFGLRDVFGIDLPLVNSAPNSSIMRTFGAGRVAYIPRIDPSTPVPPPGMRSNISPEFWKLPKNYQQLVRAVEWAAAGRLSVVVEAPLSVTMQLAEQRSSNTRLLHLVNFNVGEAVSDVSVHLRIPEGFDLREVALGKPDQETLETLTPSVHEGIASFHIRNLEVYALAFLRMGKRQ